MGLSSTRNPMVSEANRYEKREAENHRLESWKHAENAEKVGFQQMILGQNRDGIEDSIVFRT